MKIFKVKQLFIALSTLLMMGGLTACDPKLDLNNIDPSVKLSMGLTLPVGEVRATLGDFLGDSTVKFIKIDKDGYYHYVDTFSVDREFYAVDLSKYVTSTSKAFPVTAAFLAGQTYVLDFPMTVHLTDVNTNPYQERLDSMMISNAEFTSVIRPNFGIPNEALKKLEILLPTNMHRASGKVINVPLVGNWGDEQPIKIDNFSIDLIKDHSKDPDFTNVIDSMLFTFRFTIQPTVDVPVATDSKFDYDFIVNLLEYDALYGFFHESNKMIDADTIIIADEWDGWRSIQQLVLPISDPAVDVLITTAVGAPLRAEINSIWVADSLYTKKQEAIFRNGKPYKVEELPEFVKATDPLSQTCTNVLKFDKTDGSLDRLLDVRPDVIFYDLAIKTDQQREGVKQHRLTKDNTVVLSAAIDAPFWFNEGTKLEFHDTTDVNISQFSIDSLIAEVEQIDSLNVNDIHLWLGMKSMIPFDLKASFEFFDEEGKKLPIHAADDNTLVIPGPTEYSSMGYATEPGKATLSIELDKSGVNLLPKVKKIAYHAVILDVNNTSKVKYPVKLHEDTSLQIHVAVSAQADAWLKLNF